jgi:hypothetical protein
MNVLTIPFRFNGPVGIGNGGYVIVWPQTRAGRKLTAGSALLGPGGEVLARAEAVWLTVPRPGQASAKVAEIARAAGGAS